jgi:hypothetical protein
VRDAERDPRAGDVHDGGEDQDARRRASSSRRRMNGFAGFTISRR